MKKIKSSVSDKNLNKVPSELLIDSSGFEKNKIKQLKELVEAGSDKSL